MIAGLLFTNPNKKGQLSLGGICEAITVLCIPGLIGAGITDLGVFLYSLISGAVLPENWLSLSFCFGFGAGEIILIMFFVSLALKC